MTDHPPSPADQPSETVDGPTVAIRHLESTVPAAAEWITDQLDQTTGTVVDVSGLTTTGDAIAPRAIPVAPPGHEHIGTPGPVRTIAGRGAYLWTGFLDAATTATLRAIATELTASSHAMAFPTSTRVWDLYRHGSPFLDVLLDQRLRGLFETVFGEHYLISDYSLNSIAPGQPGGRWHIDYPYNVMHRLPDDDGTLGLQCVLALDPFTVHNGATELIPGTHLTPKTPDDSADRAVREPFVADPGDLMIMAASTWHRSGTNTSTTTRRAVLLSAVPRWVRPMNQPPTDTGPWTSTETLRIMLGAQPTPDTLDGIPL